jgi:hypothetical protein
MSENEKIYRQFIEFHALRWLKESQDLNIIGYLESCHGALMTYYILEVGPRKIADDIMKEIDDVN